MGCKANWTNKSRSRSRWLEDAANERETVPRNFQVKRRTRSKQAVLRTTDIFAALNAAGVKYLVVGGVAAVLYGVNRFTWDVDLAVKLTPANLEHLAKALERMGFMPRVPVPIHGLANPKLRKTWVEQKGMKVYSFIERKSPPRVVDVMVTPLRNFDQVYRRRVTVQAHGVSVPLVPVHLLVQMKQAAGRPEDILDIRALQQLGKV